MFIRPILRTSAAAVSVVLAGALAGCAGETSSGTFDSGADGTSVSALSHVHGLGAIPDEGLTYVATHEGLYTVAEGVEPELVGDRNDDFMGFTVASDGTFFASGHGAVGSGRPANMGLLVSEDRGETWRSASLSGEADFHALEYADGTVYGYADGRVQVSTDHETWEDRAVLEAADIVASPVDSSLLLATTAAGVARSTDGGRTFDDGDGEMRVYLSWPEEDALFGIAPEGELSRSPDGGETWQRLATVPGGAPHALTAVSVKHLLAATSDGVYESRDGGLTYTLLAATTS